MESVDTAESKTPSHQFLLVTRKEVFMYIEITEDFQRQNVSLGQTVHRVEVTSKEVAHDNSKTPYEKRIRPHRDALVKEYQALNNMVKDAHPGDDSKVADRVVVTIDLLP